MPDPIDIKSIDLYLHYKYKFKVFVLLKKFKNPSLETKSYEANKKSVGKVTPIPILQV